MLRLMVLIGGVVLAVAAPNSNIFQLDLDPDVAQEYLKNPPFGDPQLSGRTAVLPLVKYNDPRFRAAEAGPTLGHYWKNGREIENTDDYVEEVYNAAQFHGQDGLGAYAYGYKTPESAKIENRQRSGDLTGSYIYKAGPGKDDIIRVRYWADSQGFHQEDNIPKYVPKPVEEAPEVRAARIAHEKAWQEAANANLHPGASAYQSVTPSPTPNYQNQYQKSQQYQGQQYQGQQYQNPQYQNQQYQNQQYQNPNQYQNQNFGSYQQGKQSYNYQAQASEQHSSVVPAPYSHTRHVRQAGYGQNQYQNQYQNQDYSTTTTTTERYEEPEPTGPPKGFFYSFTYPVSIIVPKNELEGGAGSINPGYPVDDDTFSQFKKQY